MNNFVFSGNFLAGILLREAITRLMSWWKRTATAPVEGQKHAFTTLSLPSPIWEVVADNIQVACYNYRLQCRVYSAVPVTGFDDIYS